MSHRIEWRHDGRRIVLPVLILKPSPSNDLSGFNGTALLDTGSTTSGITQRVAHSLDLTRRGKRPIGSIVGEGQAERFLFRVGLPMPGPTPSFPFVFGDVIGFELIDSSTFDALIGMDILRSCSFAMTDGGDCSLQFG